MIHSFADGQTLERSSVAVFADETGRPLLLSSVSTKIQKKGQDGGERERWGGGGIFILIHL